MTDEKGTPDEIPPLRDPLKELRDKIIELHSNGMSYPAIMRMIGVQGSKDSAEFKAQEAALRRFANGDGLPAHLRLKALHSLREQLPNMDVLDVLLYAEEEKECRSLDQHLRAFYDIKKDRVEELDRQAAGNFLVYKEPISRKLEGMIRSYAKIEKRPGLMSPFMMALEYHKIVYESRAGWTSVGHDYYSGVCTKKDSCLVLFMRQNPSGAIKNMVFDEVAIDAESGLIMYGFGHMIETCDSHSEGRVATGRCAIQRIPEWVSNEQIYALVDLVPREAADDMFANHVLGKRTTPEAEKPEKVWPKLPPIDIGKADGGHPSQVPKSGQPEPTKPMPEAKNDD